MKKKILSVILSAAALFTSIVQVNAATSEQMDITNETYRQYTDSDGVTYAIANSNNINDLCKVGDWYYIIKGGDKDETATGAGDYAIGYTSAYNPTTGEYFNLEEKLGLQMTILVNGRVRVIAPRSVENYDNYLYVTYDRSGNGGYRIYDITDPRNPLDVTPASHTEMDGTIYEYTGDPAQIKKRIDGGSGMFPLTDSIAVISHRQNAADNSNNKVSFTILDTSDKNNFKEIYTADGITNYNRQIKSVVFDDNKVYAFSQAGVYVVDVSDMSNPVAYPRADLVSNFNDSKGAFAKSDDGFVLIYNNSVYLFDIQIQEGTAVATQKAMAVIPKRGQVIYGQLISGDYMYLATGTNVNNYFEIFDISDLVNGNITQIMYSQFSNNATNDDGSVGDTKGGCYGYHLYGDGNTVSMYNAYIGINEYMFGNDLIVPDGVVYDKPAIEAGDVNATVTIENITFDDAEPWVVTALYNDATLEMEDIKYEKVNVKAGEKVTKTQGLTVPETGDYSVQTFVFYDLDTILPVEVTNNALN